MEEMVDGCGGRGEGVSCSERGRRRIE